MNLRKPEILLFLAAALLASCTTVTVDIDGDVSICPELEIERAK